jgi:hypothetical protein
MDAVAGLLRDEGAIAGHARRAHERARRFSWEAACAAIDAVLRDTARSLGTRPARPLTEATHEG